MKVYSVDVVRHGPEPEFYTGNELSLVAESSPRMPEMLCSVCRSSPFWGNYPLPEAAALPPDHPVLMRIGEITERQDREKERAHEELARLSQRGGLPPDNHPIWQRLAAPDGIPASGFRELATALREALHLPKSRLICPLLRLGKLKVNCYSTDPADFCLGTDPYLVVSARTLQVLEASKCTGWTAWPVEVIPDRSLRGKALPELYELVATGKGGPPRDAVRHGFRVCPECGFAYWSSDALAMACKLRLDPEQWDGSDFFHFDKAAGVFVTERARQAIEAAGLTGVAFRASDAPIPSLPWLE